MSAPAPALLVSPPACDYTGESWRLGDNPIRRSHEQVLLVLFRELDGARVAGPLMDLAEFRHNEHLWVDDSPAANVMLGTRFADHAAVRLGPTLPVGAEADVRALADSFLGALRDYASLCAKLRDVRQAQGDELSEEIGECADEDTIWQLVIRAGTPLAAELPSAAQYVSDALAEAQRRVDQFQPEDPAMTM